MELLGASLYPQGLSYTEAMDLGKLAEDQGFDGIFAVEGGLNNDVMATVQAIASATRRITVGTGIANLYQFWRRRRCNRNSPAPRRDVSSRLFVPVDAWRPFTHCPLTYPRSTGSYQGTGRMS